MAATLAAGEGAVIVGSTALFLLGLLDRAPEGPIQLLHYRRVSLRGVKGHIDPDLPVRARTFVGKIPVAPLHLSVFFGARTLDEKTLGTCIERARRLGMKIHRLEETIERLGGPGSKGTGSLRRQVWERMDRSFTDSDLEEMFLPYLTRRGLRPQLQFCIYEGGRFRRRGDFVLPEIKVDAEADGYRTHGGLAQFKKDRDVDRILMRYGWLIPRFTYWDIVERPEEAAEDLAALVAHRRDR